MSKIISCKATSEWPGYPAHHAIDGDFGTVWNSGAFAPQSIEVELDKSSREVILGITPEMTPPFGDVTMEFLTINDDGHALSKARLTLPCQTGVMEKVCLNPKEMENEALKGRYNIKRIRITFTSSPSWIALRDIRVL